VALSRQSDKELGMMKSLRRNSQSAQLNDERTVLASLPAVEVIRR